MEARAEANRECSVSARLEPTATAAIGAVVTTVCMMAVAATATGRTIRQKWDRRTLIAILVAFTMAAAMVAVLSITALWKYQSARGAAGAGVSVAWVYTVGAGGWNSPRDREGKSALAFIEHIGDKPVVTGMDTYCKVSSIRRSLVDPN